jgi:hypothetical protein
MVFSTGKFDMAAKRHKKHKNKFSLAAITKGQEIEIQAI